jgi:hypothetical protein
MGGGGIGAAGYADWCAAELGCDAYWAGYGGLAVCDVCLTGGGGFVGTTGFAANVICCGAEAYWKPPACDGARTGPAWFTLAGAAV